MSTLLIKNGRVVTLDAQNEILENASVFIEDARIVEIGAIPGGKYTADREIDAAGRVVMPGLINTHHHLYSIFARGFGAPGKPAENFKEILERLWWKLDLALDSDDVYYSALLTLLDCARAGCTTVIDHHASPACRDGSLDRIEQAFREVGLNGCLCYEVSDRNVEAGGAEENERFIRKCRESTDDQIAALFGLHASMTVSKKTLDRCVEIARRYGTGFHVHAAEDAVDEKATRAVCGKSVLERFREAGVTGTGTVFVHGVHLSDPEKEILRETDSMLVHNPESNMNNAVGVAPVLDLLRRGVLVGLGTDGMASSMIASARAAYLLQRHAMHDPRVAFGEVCEMLLKNNRKICGRLFKSRRGQLAPGFLADVILVDYEPFTPFTAGTFYGHLLFGLNHVPVSTTVCRGKIVMENGVVLGMDERRIRAECKERARKLWQRIK